MLVWSVINTSVLRSLHQLAVLLSLTCKYLNWIGIKSKDNNYSVIKQQWFKCILPFCIGHWSGYSSQEGNAAQPLVAVRTMRISVICILAFNTSNLYPSIYIKFAIIKFHNSTNNKIKYQRCLKFGSSPLHGCFLVHLWNTSSAVAICKFSDMTIISRVIMIIIDKSSIYLYNPVTEW